jgi:hypothetical protein
VSRADSLEDKGTGVYFLSVHFRAGTMLSALDTLVYSLLPAA